MIRHLHLYNLVLVETCHIEFQPGFNVLTGETGAGKTALTEAIALLLGERVDSTLIRKGAEKAAVEGAFDIEHLPDVQRLLNAFGIPCDPGEYLIIRRELSKEGKSRALVNGQMTPLPTLQTLSRPLIDLVGQHSYHQLCTSENQRLLLDLYAECQETLLLFQDHWAREQELQEKLSEILKQEHGREKELSMATAHLQEIEAVHCTTEEETALFEEYKRLSQFQELKGKVGHLCLILSESEQSLTQQLRCCHQLCQKAAQIDNSLHAPADLLQEALIPLQEAAFQLSAHLSRLEDAPGRFAFLETRLQKIAEIKRRFGKSLEELASFVQELKTRIEKLENLPLEKDTLKTALEEIQKKTAQLAHTLSHKRLTCAKKWEQELTHALVRLNMPSARLAIQLSQAKRTHTGEDQIDFFLTANKGESPVLVKEHASGGELSRLLFAIKTTLADKNKTPTLLFDEIDANVGGKTASIIGEELQRLGSCRQVICITHFPQVAAKADHHFSVRKEESQGRTLTLICPLTHKQREEELLRMLGGSPINPISRGV